MDDVFEDEFEFGLEKKPKKKKKWKTYSPSFGIDVYADILEAEKEEIVLDEKALEKQRRKSMDVSLKYLGYKARSEKQMRDYLAKKFIVREIIDETIIRLKEYGYVDDIALAEALYRSDTQNKRLGARRSIIRMHNAGIDKEISNDIKDNAPPELELENAKYWAIKLKDKVKGEKWERKRKLSARLANKGFNFSTISQAVSNIDFDDEDTL